MVFEHVQQHILPGMVVREERQPLLHKLSQSTPIIHPLLCAGEVQEMVWPTKVMLPPTGPLYLSDKEKVARHFDYSSFKELVELALANEIDLKENVDKVCQVWLRQPTGLLQVARERGLIDPNNLSFCTVTGRKGANGVMDDSSSLRQILTKLHGFSKRTSHLQVMTEALGVRVDFTPKFHSEMAGEGVEYSWVHEKGNYWRKSLSKKRTRAGFVTLVHECLDPKTLFGQQRIDEDKRNQTLLAPHEKVQNPSSCNGF